jgi:hypothetical protein
VQIRGFYGTNRSEAFHGSGFAVAPGGVFVTNYHVISRAALDPRNYRLEYHADDGSVGEIRILAIDVPHDLAIIRAEKFAPVPLRLRPMVPPKGDRAYAIGYPLNLGLVITEGIAKGRLDNTFGQRLHYAGPITPGMSGGPALDSKGQVIGINVAFSTRGQLVSFLVPSQFDAPLLKRAESPLDAKDVRADDARQLWAHQSDLMAALPARFPTQTSGGYSLPAELAPFVDCTATVGAAPSRAVLLQSVNCRADSDLYVRQGLQMGDFQFTHQVLVAKGLGPLRFAEQLRLVADAASPAPGSGAHVTAYECRNGTVILRGLKAGVTLCARGYRMFEGLYDVSMVVVSLNREQQGFVSTVMLRGMDYATAMDFDTRFLSAIRWDP